MSRTGSLVCPGCLAEVTSLTDGRCARCNAVLASKANGDWVFSSVLVRRIDRHDGASLHVELKSAALETWTVRAEDGWENAATLGRYRSFFQAIAAAETFITRWLENAPGTSLATYVPRPERSEM